MHDRNVGARQNLIESRSHALGKCLCILECDDFWRDPQKLKRQVDFLESSPDYSVCYHDSNVVDESCNLIRDHEFDVRRDWPEAEMVAGKGFATTNSAVLRNLTTNDHKRFEVYNGDTLRWHLLEFYGKCKYIDDFMR